MSFVPAIHIVNVLGKRFIKPSLLMRPVSRSTRLRECTPDVGLVTLAKVALSAKHVLPGGEKRIKEHAKAELFGRIERVGIDEPFPIEFSHFRVLYEIGSPAVGVFSNCSFLGVVKCTRVLAYLQCQVHKRGDSGDRCEQLTEAPELLDRHFRRLISNQLTV